MSDTFDTSMPHDVSGIDAAAMKRLEALPSVTLNLNIDRFVSSDYGDVTLRPLAEGGWVVSINETWIQGIYDSPIAALAAIELPGGTLLNLHSSRGKGLWYQPISLADVLAAVEQE